MLRHAHTHISMYLYIYIVNHIYIYYKHVDILKARVDFVSKGSTQNCSRSRRSSFFCRTPCVFKFRTECDGYSFKAACWWNGLSTVSFFVGSKASIVGAQVSLPTKKKVTSVQIWWKMACPPMSPAVQRRDGWPRLAISTGKRVRVFGQTRRHTSYQYIPSDLS